MARSRHSIEQKLSALRMMEEETYTWKDIEEAHHVSEHTLRVWKVDFNHEEKTITVTVESSKTFVGILHNVIVERLISGEVEVIV
ncbi:Uncharacterised protein [Exiguobacterium aurantiacum]|uniref:Transposase n=1 Tax=Exiguobacterium aurantiacum TaxID=33987 RepID=A0A377HIL3_9BACL|nr:Uncharacterised protein [Exiguobacterium aurantiacum]